MLYRFLCNAMQRASQKAKKYGANAPQLHHIIQNAIFPLILAARRMKAM